MAILNIISRHAGEAAFLWLLRDMAVGQPHYKLKDLAKLDERLEAHLDGLRVAGDEGWEISKGELSLNEPGEVFTAAVLAFESKVDTRISEVINTAVQEQELLRSLVSALGWLQLNDARQHIEQLWFENQPSLQQAGIAASAVHRSTPPDEVLLNALQNEDVFLKARTLRAVGELGRMDMLDYIQNYLQDENTLIRFNAAISASLLGSRNAPHLLKAMLEKLDTPFKEEAVKIACMKMNIMDANNWIAEIRNNPAQLRLAIIAAGAAGDPANIPWLIEMMKMDEYSRIAGESFSMITGVDLAYEDMYKSLPEDFNRGPTEDPDDENTEMDLDENLPVPDYELVLKWWNNNKSGFKTGIPYLMGLPVTHEALVQVLKKGYQRQRTQAAWKLSLLYHGEKLFNTKAPGTRQMKMLSVK